MSGISGLFLKSDEKTGFLGGCFGLLASFSSPTLSSLSSDVVPWPPVSTCSSTVLCWFSRSLFNDFLNFILWPWRYKTEKKTFSCCSPKLLDILIDSLCWGLTTHQPLWVILCCLPEKGRKKIVEEMKERAREERGKWKKEKEQKK